MTPYRRPWQGTNERRNANQGQNYGNWNRASNDTKRCFKCGQTGHYKISALSRPLKGRPIKFLINHSVNLVHNNALTLA